MSIKTTVAGDKVKNVSSTNYDTISGGALPYWKEKTGKTVANCVAQGCTAPAIHGAHVKLNGGSTIYIAPFCASHNSSANTGNIQVNAGTKLVSIP